MSLCLQVHPKADIQLVFNIKNCHFDKLISKTTLLSEDLVNLNKTTRAVFAVLFHKYKYSLSTSL